MAMMLLGANCTVTICHSKTADLPRLVGEADIVVGAVGKPEFIKASRSRRARSSWTQGTIRRSRRHREGRHSGNRFRIHPGPGRSRSDDHQHAHFEQRRKRRSLPEVTMLDGATETRLFI